MRPRCCCGGPLQGDSSGEKDSDHPALAASRRRRQVCLISLRPQRTRQKNEKPPDLRSPLCRPYVYAVHSEQPDSFGHRLGPLSSEVSETPSGSHLHSVVHGWALFFEVRLCVCVYVCPSPAAGQPSEGDRQRNRSADEWTEADEPAPLRQRHHRGRPRRVLHVV